MLTSLLIYNARGDVLMAKFYRDGVKKNVPDVFRIHVITPAGNAASGAAAGHASRSPVLTLGSTSFMYIRAGTLWIVAVARSNQDAALVFEFLHSLRRLLEQLFARGAGPLAEGEVTGNFGLIYDILGEAVQFGYPASMEHAYLASVVPGFSAAASHRKPVLKTPLSEPLSEPPLAAVAWRQPGIKYRKNEIFLNVDEKITLLLDARGTPLRARVDGTITLKAQLSGMPVCRFGLAEAHLRRPGDFSFHQCVDRAQFAAENTIRFVPPDGTFQLMSYRLDGAFDVPFSVAPRVLENGTSASLNLRVRSTFAEKTAATGVVVRVAVPPGVTRKAASCSKGKEKFEPQEHAVLWRIARFCGQQEHLLSVDFETPAGATGWFKPKVTVDFAIDTHSASGLQVQYLKVSEKADYRTVKWVKYATSAGSYEIRL